MDTTLIAAIAVVALVAIAFAAVRFSRRRSTALQPSAAPGHKARPAEAPAAKPAAAPREVNIEASLYEPHMGRRAAGPAMPNLRAVDPYEASRVVAERPSLHRPLASRLDLPEELSARLAGSDDAVEVIAEILEVAGLHPSRDEDVLLVDGEAIVVVDAPVGQPLEEPDLTAAYLRFRSTGARHGLLLTPGLLTAAEVRRREAADPRFLHAGFDGLQRMVDAVGAGIDPLLAAPMGGGRRVP